MRDFHAFRAKCPVVNVLQGKGVLPDGYGLLVNSLDAIKGEVLVIRDHQMVLELRQIGEHTRLRGTRGLFSKAISEALTLEALRADSSRLLPGELRLPSFHDWWDGSEEQLQRLMMPMRHSKYCRNVLLSAADFVTNRHIANCIARDVHFSLQVRFHVVRWVGESDLGMLCDLINVAASTNSARELHDRLKIAERVVEFLVETNQVALIAPALNAYAETFDWSSKASPSVWKAVAMVKGKSLAE